MDHAGILAHGLFWAIHRFLFSWMGLFRFICIHGGCQSNFGGFCKSSELARIGFTASHSDAQFYSHRFLQYLPKNQKKNRMEGKKNKVIVLISILLFAFLLAGAQKKDLSFYQCAFFESYRMGNMAPWPGLISEMQKVNSTDLNWQTELTKAMYGLVGYYIGAGDKDQAKVYMDKASESVDKLLDRYPENAQLHSLSGALYGYKIGMAFYKAPFLGPKSMYHIDKAIELDPSEPMGYIEKGNSLMYRPSAFGGDKNEALVYYNKALKLIENRKDQTCNWQKMLLRAFMLKAMFETNQTSAAEAFLQEMKKDYGSMNWIKQFVGAQYMDVK